MPNAHFLMQCHRAPVKPTQDKHLKCSQQAGARGIQPASQQNNNYHVLSSSTFHAPKHVPMPESCVTASQKEEEVHKLQAELQSLLAGVTAARHEQQQQRRQLAQLHNQCQDAMQVCLAEVSHTSTGERTPLCELHITCPCRRMQVDMEIACQALQWCSSCSCF